MLVPLLHCCWALFLRCDSTPPSSFFRFPCWCMLLSHPDEFSLKIRSLLKRLSRIISLNGLVFVRRTPLIYTELQNCTICLEKLHAINDTFGKHFSNTKTQKMIMDRFSISPFQIKIPTESFWPTVRLFPGLGCSKANQH